MNIPGTISVDNGEIQWMLYFDGEIGSTILSLNWRKPDSWMHNKMKVDKSFVVGDPWLKYGEPSMKMFPGINPFETQRLFMKLIMEVKREQGS